MTAPTAEQAATKMFDEYGNFPNAASRQEFFARHLQAFLDAHRAPFEGEIERLREDCAQLYQVIGNLAHVAGVLDDPQTVKAMDNALAAAEGDPRPHPDLLPFTLRPAPPLPGVVAAAIDDRPAPSPTSMEAVARAICRYRRELDGTLAEERLQTHVDKFWSDYAGEARAAIAAMPAALGDVAGEELDAVRHVLSYYLTHENLNPSTRHTRVAIRSFLSRLDGAAKGEG